ncbi:MAG: hypothetical protein HZC40_16680 [Chloroflexi bacterium]|nr:hypothetical protein [Chloroflexota bacterium]
MLTHIQPGLFFKWMQEHTRDWTIQGGGIPLTLLIVIYAAFVFLLWNV